MNKLLLVIPLLVLSACVSSVKEMDVSSAPTETAYLIIDVDPTFDGKKAEGEAFSSVCGLGARGLDSGGKLEELSLAAMNGMQFKVFKTQKPGTYAFDGVGCHAYKVLWNKNRVKRLSTPLEVELNAGEVVYPGTVVIDWESEGFGALDLINGGGALDEDGGSLVLKRSDRSVAIKSKLLQENPELLQKFKFVTKKFKDNPLIVQ